MEVEQTTPIFGVSDFVAVFNQTIEYAYPTANIIGEIANFKISKNRWVYFDIKDDDSSIRCFGTIYQLPGPVSDGIVIQLKGHPKLHPKFGFSINLISLIPVGEGSIKRVSDELKTKLQKEGLFDISRKRELQFPPTRVGLITSEQSAAYADFISTLGKRWGGVEVVLYDVVVQGIDAPDQIAEAINYFNKNTNDTEVLIVIRGGGSADDLQAYNTEQVVRAVSSSRIPTIVAIGHKIDISLAELAADKRAITPTDAAILLVPDKKHEQSKIQVVRSMLNSKLLNLITWQRQELHLRQSLIENRLSMKTQKITEKIHYYKTLLKALNPIAILNRGYSIVRDKTGKVITDSKSLSNQDKLNVELSKGSLDVSIDSIK